VTLSKLKSKAFYCRTKCIENHYVFEQINLRLMQMCTLLDKASLDRLIVIWRIRPVKRCGFWNGKSKFNFKEASELFFDFVFKVPTLCSAFSDLTGKTH